MSTRALVRAAVYAALYVALTITPGLSAIAYGQVQFRASEALLPFACVDPAAVVGLTVGTAIANAFGPMPLVDTWFGAGLTLVATLAMWKIGPRVVALVAPVLVNGFGVPVELALVLGFPYLASVAFVSLGEAAVVFSGGLIVLALIRRRRFGAEHWAAQPPQARREERGGKGPP